MKIPVWFLVVVSTALVAGQSWLIGAVIDLKVDVGQIKESIKYLEKNE